MRVTVGTSLAPAALFLLFASCSVEELADSAPVPRVLNTCQVDADCGTGLQRGMCGSGMCVASSGQVDTAFLEIVPPASAYYGAGDSFLVALDGISRGSWTKDLSLARYANLEGMITTTVNVLGEPPSDSCEQAFDASSQSMRVHVELSRSVASRGLPGLTVAANAERAAGSTSWVFAASVPAGTYDVYATALAGCDADFPPLFATSQVLEPGDVKLELHVGALSTLSGIVSPPMKTTDEHVSLAGWTVSLVEPEQGKVISTTRKLNDSNPTNFELRYQPLADTVPLLQVVPPKDLVAPIVTWDLSVLDLDGDGQVQPSLSTLDLATVQVSASVVGDDLEPVAGAAVRLRSTGLLGAAQGLNARYEASATADADGLVTVSLLPGTYQVVVTPPDRMGLSITQAAWTIGRSPPVQAGRTVEVSPMPSVEGAVLDPIASRPIEGIAVSALPSALNTAPYYERILDPAPLVPRVASTITGQDGGFVLGVDPGTVDIAAQPSELSKFPWLVRARVVVPGEPLGPMRISFPVPLAGTLRDPSGNPVQQARLRVFAVLDAKADNPSRGDPGLAGVLQVAEGRTDKYGAFTLLLPSDLQGE